MCLKDSSVLFIMNITESSTYKVFTSIFIYFFGRVRSWSQHTGSFTAAHRLSSCGVWVPEPQASVTAVCGLSSLWHVGSQLPNWQCAPQTPVCVPAARGAGAVLALRACQGSCPWSRRCAGPACVPGILPVEQAL